MAPLCRQWLRRGFVIIQRRRIDPLELGVHPLARRLSRGMRGCWICRAKLGALAPRQRPAVSIMQLPPLDRRYLVPRQRGTKNIGADPAAPGRLFWEKMCEWTVADDGQGHFQ